MNSLNIGVVALQGAFAEHIEAIKCCVPPANCKVNVFEVRSPEELEKADALILPGGESTAMRIIGQASESRGSTILKALQSFAKSGRVIWGTCAGCILLSDHVSSVLGGGRNDQPAQLESVKASSLYGDHHIGGIDINTCRNFFGRQTKSFETLSVSTLHEFDSFPCVFIRAPAIVTVGPLATKLASIVHNNEEIVVAARQANLMSTCFHPELTTDRRIHQYFLDLASKPLAYFFFETRLYLKSCLICFNLLFFLH